MFMILKYSISIKQTFYVFPTKILKIPQIEVEKYFRLNFMFSTTNRTFILVCDHINLNLIISFL